MFFFLMTREAFKKHFSTAVPQNNSFKVKLGRKNVLEANFKTFTTHWKVDMNNVKHMQFTVDGLDDAKTTIWPFNILVRKQIVSVSHQKQTLCYSSQVTETVLHKGNNQLCRNLCLQKIQTL